MRLLSIFLLLLLLINSAKSQNVDDIKLPLIEFLRKLSPNNPNIERDLDWNAASNPCLGRWGGISCNNRARSLRSINLESLNLSGTMDGNLLTVLCNSSSLSVLSLKNNSITGDLPPEIAGCSQLTSIFLSNNRLSGRLPSSLPNLRNLKRLDISSNNFSDDLPWNLSRISGLVTFLADNNNFTGSIPEFDLNYFNQFNVSFNKLSGSVPLNSTNFPISSFIGNPGLCGPPLQVSCPPPPPPPPPPHPSKSKSKKLTVNDVIMVLGYVLFGLALVLFLVYRFLRKKKKKSGTPQSGELSDRKVSDSREKTESTSRSEYSISLPQSVVSTSLVVLRKDGRTELKFEELLRAPAELLGKGRFGSLYKVVMDGGTELAVKRIKDWTMTGEEFQKKIMTMDHAIHPNILPVTAFYCSKQEKLVVYEYQKNGSLFKLLHDNKEGMPFNWTSRLNVAAGVSAGLAFMHQSLGTKSSGHGNLKSSNIILSSSMEPLISEYGLTAFPSNRLDSKASDAAEPFSPDADVYAFGVVVLELLTVKPSHGFDLAQWVNSVVREEWTVEVFDRSLLAGDNGERADEAMLRLLQVALRCMTGSQIVRPTMVEVASMVKGLKEKHGRSVVSEV